MDVGYTKGVAFICEGETEKEFYYSLLERECRKVGVELIHQTSQETSEVYDEITLPDKKIIIKSWDCGGIHNVNQAGPWFRTECTLRYKTIEWLVFLCYDTETYQEDITAIGEKDWMTLEKNLPKKKVSVYHVAAAADIEDAMLVDLEGICRFLSCKPVNIEDLKGRKGKVKLKNLYRANGQTYHEGSRARDLIDSLDMEKIIESGILPLKDMICSIFGTLTETTEKHPKS